MTSPRRILVRRLSVIPLSGNEETMGMTVMEFRPDGRYAADIRFIPYERELPGTEYYGTCAVATEINPGRWNIRFRNNR